MCRGIASAIAVTALFIAALLYYAAYFMVGLLAFVLLWHSGDLNAAWRALFVAFAIVVTVLGMALKKRQIAPATISCKILSQGFALTESVLWLAESVLCVPQQRYVPHTSTFALSELS
jgi:hypothetical protein